MDPYEPPPEPTVDVSTLFHSMASDEPPPEPTVDVSNMFQGPPETVRGFLVISLGMLLAPVLGGPAAVSGFYGFSVAAEGSDGMWVLVGVPFFGVVGLAWGILSHEWSKKPVVGPMAILKLLRGRSRMKHSFVQIKERYRIEVVGNAVFARHERLDRLSERSYSSIRAKLASISPQQVATCSVVLSELLHGAEKYGNRLQRLNIIKSLLAPFPSVPFDEVDATCYATIRHDLELQGQVIGPYPIASAFWCGIARQCLVKRFEIRPQYPNDVEECTRYFRDWS